MLTAFKDKHENICKELGALESWSKPLDPDEMLENIKQNSVDVMGLVIAKGGVNGS